MLKKSLMLLNLDTGEAFALGKVILADAADWAPPGHPDPRVYSLAALWHDDMGRQLREDPDALEGRLRALSTFLVANRGQPLSIVEAEHFEEVAAEVTDALGIDQPLTAGLVSSGIAKTVLEFARRRWNDLVHPDRLDDTSGWSAIHRGTRMTTEVATRIKNLVRRKLRDEQAERLSDARPGDYPGFETFEKYAQR